MYVIGLSATDLANKKTPIKKLKIKNCTIGLN
jgi:hypothetical protein